MTNHYSHYYKTGQFSLSPKQSTTWHNHHEIEIFIPIKGEGTIILNGETQWLIPGEMLTLMPLKTHVITNTSETETLTLCHFWWNDEKYFQQAIKQRFDRSKLNNTSPDQPLHLILPSFTTPNGPLHVGHLAGPLLMADMLKRTYQLYHHKTYLLSGTIGYQTQVQVEANQRNETFLETALHYSNSIQHSLNCIDIHPDCFVTLADRESMQLLANTFLDRLMEKGYLVEKEEPVYFCDHCEKYLFEANIVGHCPHCDHEVNAECESCYEYFPEKAIKHPVCSACQKTPRLKPLKRLHIELERFRYVIEALYHCGTYNRLSRPFIEKILKKPLPDIPMSILSESGTPLQHEDYSGHMFYSAVELVPRFLAATAILFQTTLKEENWEDYLQTNPLQLHLLFGVDNLYLRTVIFPILLHLYNAKLVDQFSFYCNEFYQLDHSKFSTSRRHVVSIETLSAHYDIEFVRYYLALTRPEYTTTNFSFNELAHFVEQGPLNVLTTLAEKLKKTLEQRFDGFVPEAGAWDVLQENYAHFLEIQLSLAQSYLNPTIMQMTDLMKLFNVIIHHTQDFYQTSLTTSMSRSLLRTSVALVCKGILSLSILLSPICPTLAERLQRLFCADKARLPLDIQYVNRWISKIHQQIIENHLTGELV